jgi:uncharacterized protein (TIGR02996 family)
MSTEEGLLRAICAEPDDDGLRLIYADWLEDRGDEDSLARAEFIRVQVALASMTTADPQRDELELRERDLLTAHEERWAAPFRRFHLEVWGFERGLIEYMILPADSFLRGAEELFSATPLQEVRFIPETGSMEELVDHPALARLRGLDLAGCHIGNEGLLTLMPLGRLSILNLAHNNIDDRGGYALAEAPSLPNDVRLDLRGNRLSRACRAALRARFVHPVLLDAELP